MRKLIIVVVVLVLLIPCTVSAKKDKTDWQLRALEAEAKVAQLTAWVQEKDKTINLLQQYIQSVGQQEVLIKSQDALRALDGYKKSLEKD